MAERRKFEEMLERLVNEDAQGAKDLFHEIVVEKSRRIYESLLESDMYDEELEEDEDLEEGDELEEDEDLEEGDELEEDEDLEEDWGLEEDFDIEEDFDLEEDEFDEAMMADAGDDFEGDIADDMPGGDEMPGGDVMAGLDDEDESDVNNKIADLEDELDALKAEFEDMMSDMDKDDDMGDDDDMMADMGDDDEDDDEGDDDMMADMGDDDDEGDDMGDDDMGDDEAVAEGEKSVAQLMREYTETVTANMGPNGDNTKSPVANKNDMGGTTANIVAGGDGGKGGTGASTPKIVDANNRNVPGGLSAKKGTKKEPGHGPEKKGKKPDSAKSMFS